MNLYQFRRYFAKSQFDWLIAEVNERAAWQALVRQVGKPDEPPRAVFCRYVLARTVAVRRGVVGRGRSLPGSYLMLCGSPLTVVAATP